MQFIIIRCISPKNSSCTNAIDIEAITSMYYQSSYSPGSSHSNKLFMFLHTRPTKFLLSYSLTFNSVVKPFHSDHIALEAKNRNRSVPSRRPCFWLCGFWASGPAEPEDVGQRMEFHINCYVGIGGVADLNLRP